MICWCGSPNRILLPSQAAWSCYSVLSVWFRMPDSGTDRSVYQRFDIWICWIAVLHGKGIKNAGFHLRKIRFSCWNGVLLTRNLIWRAIRRYLPETAETSWRGKWWLTAYQSMWSLLGRQCCWWKWQKLLKSWTNDWVPHGMIIICCFGFQGLGPCCTKNFGVSKVVLKHFYGNRHISVSILVIRIACNRLISSFLEWCEMWIVFYLLDEKFFGKFCGACNIHSIFCHIVYEMD